MDGLMMAFPLTLPHLFQRAVDYYPEVEIVSRRPDKSLHRTNYGEFHGRSLQLANALKRLGLKPGERVATLAWNHYRHLEAYFGIPLAEGVFHTLNPRLSPTDLAYIMNDAEDVILLVDDVLLPVWEKLKADVKVRQVVVWAHGQALPEGTLDYEQLLAAEPKSYAIPAIDENQAAGLCYTSGTTGRPKGVLYSHRALVLHSMVSALPDVLGASFTDVVLPVVPMFHVNAWGLPFTCTMIGAKQVFPGPHLDAVSLLDLMAGEGVTKTAGVPTIWLSLLDALDKAPAGTWDLSKLNEIISGGAAAPPSMIERFERDHGLKVVQAWGMTEMTPLGTVSRIKPSLAGLPAEAKLQLRATQGLPVPLVEVRVESLEGPAPWDGKAMGELMVRGPFIASSYFKNPAEASKFTEDGWFRTGDIVTTSPEGYVRITDRSKDLIKSGGEWISSVDLENALIGHPAVAEAAVVAVAHPKWDERPVACVVLRPGASATPDELRDYLAPKFAKFWLPDAYLFMEAIPRTATGKFMKMALRKQLKDFRWTGNE